MGVLKSQADLRMAWNTAAIPCALDYVFRSVETVSLGGVILGERQGKLMTFTSLMHSFKSGVVFLVCQGIWAGVVLRKMNTLTKCWRLTMVLKP